MTVRNTLSTDSPNDAVTPNLIANHSHLLPCYITNLAPGHIINDHSIAAGVQVVVPQPLTGAIGDIFTLYWGQYSVQRAYDGANFPWIIDLAAVFDPAQLFKNGRYVIYYAEMDGAGNVAKSAPQTVTVVRHHPHHTAPPAAIPTDELKQSTD
ncbi:hypothetical protein SJI19_08130 [Acerihabitans sp. TG2]|uniref:hypothetical protein n=1 Tax=Acerihabitans sp. TG2 TaxID=3096008 RepID=UPI002B2268E9|nr:hypothetical protein [Acerihabitans sp. TG2]MEA9390507.1 hypothetical protein [Acerihabitans sp. TG2]